MAVISKWIHRWRGSEEDMENAAKALFGSLAFSAILGSAGLLVPLHEARAAEGTRASGANVCLNTTEIAGSRPVDSRTILFRMRDGKVWRNTLKAPCPDLVAQGGGFSQYAHTDYICGNTQHITVAATGMVCRLGEFSRAD
jgi:hypothetical protein